MADDYEYHWRGELTSGEVELLHAEGFQHAPIEFDWVAQLERHSLGWVCGRRSGRLVGFVNLAWDGCSHAVLLDTLVAAEDRRRGVGKRLVEIAKREAQAAGCEWLHVDFEDHLKPFYFDACGFMPTNAGLIRLRSE